MAEKIVKSSDERGALMLEAIALLGLMTMMSPMVVRQTADRTSEMEEVAVAGQMKTLRDAVSSYIDANYANIAAWASGTDAQTLPLNDLRPYLPPAFFQDDGTLGNKLIDNYQVGIRRERPCADLTKDECNRWKITGLISSMGEELDDRRAARIATMVGADGGYIRSTQALNALFPGNEAEAKKAIGAQGIWEIDDVTQFFPGGNVGKGRVVATTTYTSGLGGDFLYRHAVNSLPEANSMFTDIDMSGMGSGAHRIRHSGGLEVVNGKIIVRDSRNNDWDADAATTISNKELTMTDADVSLTKGNTSFNMTEGNVSAATAGGELGVTNVDAYMAAGGAEVSLNSGAIYEGGDSFDQEITGDSFITAGGTYDLEAADEINMTSTSGAVNIKGASGQNKGINLNTNYATGTGTSSSQYGLFMRSSTPRDWESAAGARNRIIGGLNLYGSTTRSSPMFSMASSSKNTNGNNVFLAVHSYWNDNKSLVLHSSTSRDASDEFFTGSDSWQGNNKADPMLWSADASLQALGSGADNAQNGGRLQLGANERMRVNLIGNAKGGHMTMYAPDASGAPVATAVLAATQHKYDGTRGGIFALGTGFTNAVETDSWTNKTGNNNDAMFYMNARTGEANMPGFAPTKIALKSNPTTADDYGTPVQSIIKASFDGSGKVAAGHGNAVNIPEGGKIKNQLTKTDVAMSGGIASTYLGGDTTSEDGADYSRFEVDPAFVSVMNDIKLTSRGGAHLADILPNYINKGIYVLSNTYAAGPWPCDEGNTCNFLVPRLTKKGTNPDTGASTDSPITSGAWENDPSEMAKYLANAPHSIKSDSFGVSYYASKYLSCKDAGKEPCLTHPYLGVVPAPGRAVTEAGEATDDPNKAEITGYDEGPCPDGYLPVMTVTPTAIEVGKVNHIDMRVSMGGTEEDSYVYYNLENIDFSKSRASIYQPATAVSTAVDTVTDSRGVVYGWKVALGTISTMGDQGAISHGLGYVWNQGGVWQDSMKAVAHTYCYFNPSRFTFPNMVVDSNNLLRPQHAPRKIN